MQKADEHYHRGVPILMKVRDVRVQLYAGVRWCKEARRGVGSFVCVCVCGAVTGVGGKMLCCW